MSKSSSINEDMQAMRKFAQSAGREQHESELAASHARGQSEDLHNKRMRLMREIDRDMKKYIIPIIKGSTDRGN